MYVSHRPPSIVWCYKGKKTTTPIDMYSMCCCLSICGAQIFIAWCCSTEWSMHGKQRSILMQLFSTETLQSDMKGTLGRLWSAGVFWLRTAVLILILCWCAFRFARLGSE